MSGALEGSIVRIYNSTRSHVVGSGFYVGDGIVITCAHVISQSIYGGVDNIPPGVPEAPIELDFPLSGVQAIYQGRVVCITPIKEDQMGDVAVIQLDTIISTQSIFLMKKKFLWGHDFRAFGFPGSQKGGLWVSGKILGTQANNWLQVETDSATKIEPGFSGAAVWDDELSGIVGMVVRITRKEMPVAFVIPTETLIKSCPLLEKFILIQPNSLSDLIEASKLQIQEKLAYYRLRRNSVDVADLMALAVLLTAAQLYDEAITILLKCQRYIPSSAYLHYLMALNLLRGNPPRLLSRDGAIAIRNELLKAIELDKKQGHIVILLLCVNQEYFDKKGFLSTPSHPNSLALLKESKYSSNEMQMLFQLVPDTEKHHKKYFT